MFTHCPPMTLPDLVSETLPDGKRYYTTPSGIKLPSVTTVVGAMKKDSIMEWRKRVGETEANKVSKLATARGNGVHAMAEQFLKNEDLNTRGVMPFTLAMFNSIKPLIIDNIDNIHYIEQSLWSERVGMAGRVDLIAEWNGVLSVIDFKTSKKVKSEKDIQDYFAQCVAYSLMYKEHVGKPINQLVILMGVEGSKPLVFVKSVREYIPTLFEHIKYYKSVVPETH